MELFVEQGGLAGQIIPLEQAAVTFGRGGKTAEGRIALPEQGVSRQHARIQRGPEGWVLVDLGSTNGTFLNGQRIPAQELCPLHPGDRVSIAGAVLLVRGVGAAEPGQVAGTLAGQVAGTLEAEAAPAGAGAPHPASAGHPGRSNRQRPTKRALHPALLAAGAFLLVVVLVGIVILLANVLQPAPEATTPTPGAQMQQLMATVVPTEFQEVVTAVAPLMTSLPLPLLGPASTATP